MMKKVVLFGTTGRTGRYITERLQKETDMELTVMVRNPVKIKGMNLEHVTVVRGDALNAEDVRNALEDQNILICSLSGDVKPMAENIVSALSDTPIRRIIWITGMGIHNEMKGINGVFLRMLAKRMPEYIEAADLIAQATVNTTLLRCGGITDGDNSQYDLSEEGTQPQGKLSVERAAIAECIAAMINDESLGENASLGITN